MVDVLELQASSDSIDPHTPLLTEQYTSNTYIFKCKFVRLFSLILQDFVYNEEKNYYSNPYHKLQQTTPTWATDQCQTLS